jgi:transposase
MEATGQYWKPIWYVLEERGFQLLLVNARHDQDPARPQDRRR